MWTKETVVSCARQVHHAIQKQIEELNERRAALKTEIEKIDNQITSMSSASIVARTVVGVLNDENFPDES